MTRDARLPSAARNTAVVVLTAALAMAAARPAAAALGKDERKLVAAVDRHAPAALGLLRRAVEINSGTMNPDGVREVGKVFAAEFEALGFTTRWADGASWGRGGHLIATRPGKGKGGADRRR